MKRPTYVDERGNRITTNDTIKLKTNIYWVIGTVVPIIILGLIGYQIYTNVSCNKVYDKIKKASYEYLESKNDLPSFEGENEEVNITELYEKRFLSNYETDNQEFSGKVKITKVKDDYVYTLNITSGGMCATNKKYGAWSSELNSYPKGKAIVDVIPYYNYYDVEVGVTEWTKYFDDDELNNTIDKVYNMRIPIDETALPTVPDNVKVIGLETEYKTLYTYQDKLWKWYDIVGDYSDFSSEMPSGYSLRDDNTEKYTEWSAYSYKKPDEKDYRSIQSATAYKFYYLDENNEKVYYNNAKYAVEADREKYPYMDTDYITMFRYRDKVWRWYNGTKRKYSSYTANPESVYKYKDEELYSLSGEASWKETSSLTEQNKSYRVETTKVQTRFRVKYELSSLPIFKEAVDKDTFVKKIGEKIPKFAKSDNVRVEVTYKYKYRKS